MVEVELPMAPARIVAANSMHFRNAKLVHQFAKGPYRYLVPRNNVQRLSAYLRLIVAYGGEGPMAIKEHGTTGAY